METGRGITAAPAGDTNTNARDAGSPITELRSVLLQIEGRARTPLHAEAWHHYLTTTGLISKYPELPNSIHVGFHAGIRRILHTSAPPNNNSVYQLSEVFNEIIDLEISRGRYLGPFPAATIEALVGPFQSSPLSLVPKPGKPGKYRLIQNLSYPRIPTSVSTSINHTIDSNLYPCLWGTFTTICLMIWRLPPGSQGACRDVAEAYRNIPLLPSQWAGTVVRLSEDNLYMLNLCNSFGLRSAGGIFGRLADAGVDLMRAIGLGPISKWVDDHAFVRILKRHREHYNRRRLQWKEHIITQGGQHHDRGRIWFGGNLLESGITEEFDDDMVFPLLDHSGNSPRSDEDAKFTYNFADIDTFTSQLGIPWELSKDVPFSSSMPFTGLIWDLENKTVALSRRKALKYREAITAWHTHPAHDLQEVRELYGKLLHTCLVLPRGRAHLTCLEAMLGFFHQEPFKPRTPPKSTGDDLQWWHRRLSLPSLIRSIPGPVKLDDFNAFSDASSTLGIGIVIKGYWRAWRLIPGWKQDGRDIGWAEAMGFLFLVQTILANNPTSQNIKVYGDNRGVVEGWWKGRSRNPPTNTVFRRIHDLCETAGRTIHTRYVASKDNPADGPSRLVFPPERFLLPPVKIPLHLQHHIVDFDHPPTPIETRLHSEQHFPIATTKTRSNESAQRDAALNFEFERRGEELHREEYFWDSQS